MNETHKMRLLAAWVGYGVGFYVLGFTSMIALGVILVSLAQTPLYTRTLLTQRMPTSTLIWSGAIVVVLVAYLLISAMSGETKDLNAWFLGWPYRPHAAVVFCGLCMFGAYREARVNFQAAAGTATPS